MNLTASSMKQIALIAVTLLVLISPQVVSAQDPAPESNSLTLEANGLEAYSDDYTVVNQTATPDGVNTVVRVNVAQDSFLSSAQPNSNFGTSSDLRMGWESGSYNALRPMIQFDLGGIPSNATIHSATLYIYLFQSIPSNDYPMTFRAQFVTSSWNEYGVTWNNANYLGGTALPLEDANNAIGWKSTDVTGLIHTWQSGSQPNHGLILTGDEVPSDDRSRIFAARESGVGAYIEVDYSVQCDNVAPVAYVENLPVYQPGTYLVSWTGQDYAPTNCTPSGIANYDVYYRINYGSWVHWKQQTSSTSNHFKNYASNGDYVELTARATDRAGNVQPVGPTQTATTIDTEPPTTSMTPLPKYTATSYFTVNWSGTDNLAGVNNYDLQWRGNGGAWVTLVEGTMQTSYNVTGAQPNDTYDFRVRATDNVGNVQDYPENPQATTTIRDYPEATVLPFQPPIIKPTDAVTDRFTVNWSGLAAPGTEIVSFQIFYQYEDAGWTAWKTFPGTQYSEVFLYKDMGLGDGYYGFEAIATNNLGQTQPRTQQPQAGILVDLADRYFTVGYLPMIPAE